MSYQVLARKYRPANFQELEGQEHVLRALISALENERLHHAYLFTGTRGVGKTTIARILARCLNCETGITATPCNTCRTCVEISEGRSVDLLEVDAASKTGIDDMRELLDNVQYMPSSSRFKIYLIDEVHMLSRNAFNAMLKTLEEPPEHVKFLFATTDPKKLPITILSRCLQFNLKNLSPERIVGYLKKVLDQEQVSFEDGALWQLGRAAEGSMRDALSLTDQAIAYGQGQLVESDVAAMLGTIDLQVVYRLLDKLSQADAAAVLAEVEGVAEFGPDYAALLDDVLAVLHRVAIAQMVPGGVDNSQGDQALIEAFAHTLSPEQVQLFYQIALVGKRDLPLAPDARVGFEMVLLRMLAFEPADTAAPPAPTTGGGGPAPRGPETPADPAPGGERRSPVADILDKINAEPDAPTAQQASPARNGKSQLPAEGESIEPAVSSRDPANTPTNTEVAIARLTTGAPAAGAPAAGSPAAETPAAESTPATAIPIGQARPATITVPRPATGHESAPVETDRTPTARADETEDPAPTESEPPAAAASPMAGSAKCPEDFHWPDVCGALNLGGVTRNLAMNCSAAAFTGEHLTLHLEHGQASFYNENQHRRINTALSDYLKCQVKLTVKVVDDAGITPAHLARQAEEAAQAEAVAAIERDGNIQSLISNFNAVLDRTTIAPVRPGDNR